MSVFVRTKLFEARPFKAKDAPLLASWMSVSPMDLFMLSSSLVFPVRPETLIENFERTDPKERRFYSVFLVGTDKHVGHFEIKNISERHKTGTGAHIILAPEHRGKGMGKHFMGLISKTAFCALGLYRISLSVHEINRKAIAVYTKAGYKKEGLIRDVLLFNGRRYSLYQMSLLHSEWKGK